ncbi:unknown protein [Grouper iridovirus]|uniref:Uncharacterized protein n=1 Tax=Grouper iridovirus TaxID=127569 RepID=Q5GAC3_9VIRU|nr:unknown protein [Grouper iridovirus]
MGTNSRLLEILPVLKKNAFISTREINAHNSQEVTLYTTFCICDLFPLHCRGNFSPFPHIHNLLV